MNDQQKILSLVEKYKEVIHTQNQKDFYDLW